MVRILGSMLTFILGPIQEVMLKHAMTSPGHPPEASLGVKFFYGSKDDSPGNDLAKTSIWFQSGVSKKAAGTIIMHYSRGNTISQRLRHFTV